ncbi:MAG: hypothetical protein M1282_13360 [Chloroflexi bacterium]|nr:hypothetical protein [Chloroflexota bacterium]
MAQHAVVQEKPAQTQTTAEAYEPLLPVEKKLIAWSLILGVVLLVILIGVSYAFFPGSF